MKKIWLMLIILITGITLVYYNTGQRNISNHDDTIKIKTDLTGNDYWCPYGSDNFNKFVEDSYKNGTKGDKKEFFEWIDKHYLTWRDGAIQNNTFPFKGRENLTFTHLLDWINNDLTGITDRQKKTEKELEILIWLHKFTKTIIPKFSLERGYEFRNTVALGERQCFLQSVLISSILQSSGFDAGVAMIYINDKGAETNNGHAVALVKLSNGHDIIVDASDPVPFMKHIGIFTKDSSGYKYLLPEYNENSEIVSYKYASNGSYADPSEIKTLDISFLFSQFYFYRGEWVKGGLHYKKTKEGLKQAERYMEKSIEYCKGNPLSVYFMGRIYEEEGNTAKAKEYFDMAKTLYKKYGWTYKGLKDKL